MKSKIIDTELDYYPEPTCCICGKVCEVYEIHPHDEQMWCWCKDCQFDTFHKPINSTDDMNDKLKEAIETLGRLKHYIQTDVNRYGGGWDSIVEAIDTVVSELEKPLPADEQMKERGNLTCRVMLRQLNCKHENNHVTISVKELKHWFETGQHLKEWKEWDTI